MYTPQQRGTAFNELLAQAWQADGIGAETGVRGAGGHDEVDVFFEYRGIHWILEAKWLNTAVNVDPIATHQERLNSRPAGTRGVFVSMSGYTESVITKAAQPRWPQLLLLDRAHVEAVISGLLSPAALLDALMRHTARHGGSYVPLDDLLLVRPPAPPGAGPADEVLQGWQTVLSTLDGVRAEAVLAGRPGWSRPSGMSPGPDGGLLITTPDGVLTLDPENGRTAWALPLQGCHGRALSLPDGGTMAVCNGAVVRWNGSLHVVAGGFQGPNTHLLRGPGGEPWVFQRSTETQQSEHFLARLGETVGEEEVHVVHFPAAVLNAVWLDGRRFLLSANGHSATVDLDRGTSVSRDAWIPSAVHWPEGVARCGDSIVVAEGLNSDGRRVVRYDPSDGSATEIARLQANYLLDLAPGHGDQCWVLADTSGNDPQVRPTLVSVIGLDRH